MEPPANIRLFIREEALRQGADPDQLLGTLKCESRLSPEAIGDSGNSYGIAQIHLPSHPEISREQALNPVFAIRWAAYEFSHSRAWQWTCWRKTYATVKK